MLIVGALEESASRGFTVVQNALVILDLRLERWLNVVVPILAALRYRTHIGFGAEGRLC